MKSSGLVGLEDVVDSCSVWKSISWVIVACTGWSVFGMSSFFFRACLAVSILAGTRFLRVPTGVLFIVSRSTIPSSLAHAIH